MARTKHNNDSIAEQQSKPAKPIRPNRLLLVLSGFSLLVWLAILATVAYRG